MRVHSVVKLITNSSSETFTVISYDARERIITFIDAILITAGSNLRAEDLFEFQWVMHPLLGGTRFIDVDKVNDFYEFDPPATNEEDARNRLFEYAVATNISDVYVEGLEQYEDTKAALWLRVTPKEGVICPLPEIFNALADIFEPQEYDWN
jgi:hypothetical protein